MTVTWQQDWTNRYYRDRPGWRDGTTEFHALCRSRTQTASPRILEVGAGATNPTSAFLASFGELHGMDVDEEVKGNVHLASCVVAKDGKYPYPDAHFDMVVSNYVVEHVEDPVLHLQEIFRVLRPGGSYVFRTPNLWHYVSMFSYLTPHSTHTLLANRLRGIPEGSHEPWPTVYAMNTRSAVHRHASRAGFQVDSVELVEKEPSYGMYARPMFLAFMAYERLVNASELLSPLRANLFVALRKAKDHDPAHSA